jgi:hypothetical protein
MLLKFSRPPELLGDAEKSYPHVENARKARDSFGRKSTKASLGHQSELPSQKPGFRNAKKSESMNLLSRAISSIHISHTSTPNLEKQL